MSIPASSMRARLLQMWPLALLCAVGLAIYLPGLNGAFLFDDFANLPALGRYGPVDDFAALLRYLTSGIADPTGRPVAMLSFLVDANNWPASPWPFKRTNVLLHLLNGCLLYLALSALAGARAPQARPAMLLATALWTLHPLWVSTVLYVVQRHAMLATTFVLAGIILWARAQQAFAAARPGRGWALALASMGLCGLLAGLSKPNGFLLPLLLLVLQATVLRTVPSGSTAAATSATRLLLILPGGLMLLGIALMAWNGDHEARAWSIGERALTQPRVLFDYLSLLALPTAYSSGVFADGYIVSRGLLTPPSTLPAWLGVLALAALATWLRRRQPIAAAALGFFLVGHLLESTILPLELYFEHRNYLPALLLFWPLSTWLLRPGPMLRVRQFAAVAWLLLLTVITLARADLWGRPLELALNFARDQPASARAQANAAVHLLAVGHHEHAVALLTPLSERNPDEVQYALTLMNATCAQGRSDPVMVARAERAMAATGVGSDVAHQWLVGVLKGGPGAACRELTPAQADGLLAALQAHPKRDAEIESRLLRLAAFRALRERQCDVAVDAFNRRLDIQRRPEAAVEQVGFLVTRCSPAAALRHLEHYRSGAALGDAPAYTWILRLRDRIMERDGYWQRELDRLQTLLEEDRARSPAAD